MTLFALLWALGCASGDPATSALSEPPDDPKTALAFCADNPFPELATTCYVQVAARAASRGDETSAQLACERTSAGTWQQECHFRVGEELARQGRTLPALRHCRQAGRFARYCLTHAGWGLPPETGLDSRLSPNEVLRRIGASLSEVDAVLAGAPDGLEGEGRDIFRSRMWFNLYYGTGIADPAPARAAPADLAPFARGAFALEAVRILFPVEPPSEALQRVRAVWNGETPVPTGTPINGSPRFGRYHSPVPAPAEALAPKVPVFGGGLRLVGESEEQDLDIATLEALFFRPETHAEAFWPFVTSPEDRLRWTAVRLFRLTPPEEMDMVATLTGLLSSDDENTRWNARDALDGRTWVPRDHR